MRKLDAEFVCVEKEEFEMKEDGRRVFLKPARLVLARVSVVRGDRVDRMGLSFFNFGSSQIVFWAGDVVIDDYIRTSEPVIDYLTKYSGILPGEA